MKEGCAELSVATVRGRCAVVRCIARNPIRLLTPRSNSQSVWAYTSNFGGGMVAGDRTSLNVHVASHARCFLGSQSSTKIYRNPAKAPCAYELRANIEDHALLVLAPDPVQCFADSSYEQVQTFEMSGTSDLVLVDWFSSGRSARGERWAFRRYASRNEIRRDGQLILLDPLDLDASRGSMAQKFGGGRFNCLATVVLLGPRVETHARQIFEYVSDQKVQRSADLIFAAGPLAEGVLLRVAGLGVEAVGRTIHQHLHFVKELVEDDFWLRKW